VLHTGKTPPGSKPGACRASSAGTCGKARAGKRRLGQPSWGRRYRRGLAPAGWDRLLPVWFPVRRGGSGGARVQVPPAGGGPADGTYRRGPGRDRGRVFSGTPTSSLKRAIPGASPSSKTELEGKPAQARSMSPSKWGPGGRGGRVGGPVRHGRGWAVRPATAPEGGARDPLNFRATAKGPRALFVSGSWSTGRRESATSGPR